MAEIFYTTPAGMRLAINTSHVVRRKETEAGVWVQLVTGERLVLPITWEQYENAIREEAETLRGGDTGAAQGRVGQVP